MGWLFILAGIGAIIYSFKTAKLKWVKRITGIIVVLIGIGMFAPPEPPESAKQAQSQPEQTKQEETKIDPKAELLDFIKKTNSDITEVELIEQFNDKGDATGKYRADISIKKDPFMGGKSDWNSVASDIFHISKEIFTRPIDIAYFKFYSPANKDLDWAYVMVKRNTLPPIEDWNKFGYQWFFSQIEPDGGTLQTKKWLCQFYDEYEDTRPGPLNKMPEWCRPYLNKY